MPEPSSWFTPFFSFMSLRFIALYLFLAFINLRLIVMCLTPFGWLLSIMLDPYLPWKYTFWFIPTFSGIQLGRKTRAGCMWYQFCLYDSQGCEHFACWIIRHILQRIYTELLILIIRHKNTAYHRGHFHS